MAIPIAKLAVEIGADSDKLNKGLKDADSKLTEFGKSSNKLDGLVDKTNELFVGVGKVAAGFSAGVFAINKGAEAIFEYGKAGAVLDYTRDKFDRLSKSIGSSSDVLLGKLREITHGMRADSELITAATDVMSLGLVKTEEEALRLVRVVGGLNMDTNQLVLALTNQTKARFDQLNLSTDGFDERLKRLKDTGMDTNAAFTEAFLQQAEAQMDKVGDSAESAIAPYMELEATFKNLSDTLKNELSPAITEVVKNVNTTLSYSASLESVMNQHNQTMLKSAGSYEEYYTEMVRAASASGYVVKEKNGEIQVFQRTGRELIDVTDKINISTNAMFNEARAVEHGSAVWEARLQVWKESQGVVSELGSVSEEALTRMSGAASNTIGSLDTLIQKQGQLKADMQSWIDSTASMTVNMLENQLPEGSAKLVEAYGVVDEVMGTSYTKQYELEKSVKDLTTAYANGKISSDKFKEGLQAIKDEGLAGMKSDLEEVTQKAQELYEKLLQLPAEIKIRVGFEVGDFPGFGAAQPSKPKFKSLEELDNAGITLPGNRQANGGDWLVKEPTLFLAGEAGWERATFTPVGKNNSGGGDGITVNVHVAEVKDNMDMTKMAMEVANQIRRYRL